MDEFQFKRYLVLTPIHRRPDLVADQIVNYESFFKGEALYLIHPSAEGRAIVPEVISKLSCLSDRLWFSPVSGLTSWASVFPAFLKIFEHLKGLGGKGFETVYLHTDGDLLVKGDVKSTLCLGKAAYSSHQISESWFWYKKMKDDVLFQRIREFLGIRDDQIVGGRQEGAFFDYDVWSEAMGIIANFYNDDFFLDAKQVWPVEECVFPTVLRKIHPEISPERVVVRTKGFLHGTSGNPRDFDENCVQVDDIKDLLSENDRRLVGVKWFSQDFEHPARRFVRSLIK